MNMVINVVIYQGCTLDSYYDEDENEIVYKASIHPGVPAAGSLAGLLAKGAIEGVFGVGQQYYFNQMNPFQSLMNSVSFGMLWNYSASKL